MFVIMRRLLYRVDFDFYFLGNFLEIEITIGGNNASFLILQNGNILA